jgi:hypothetical protein
VAENLLIISPCFYPDVAPAYLMVKSAARNNLKVWLYGVGQLFIPDGADAQVAKLHELMTPKKESDYVLITDCRDVLFLGTEEEILRKFQSFGKDLVMSTERMCWTLDPDIARTSTEFQRFFHGQDMHGYDYIHAGQYIGTWEYVMLSLQHLLSRYRRIHPGIDNPQAWWMWAKMRGELDYALDYKCQIFQSMAGGADSHLRQIGVRLYNRITNSIPCSLHFNGNLGNDEPQKEMYRRLYDIESPVGG